MIAHTYVGGNGTEVTAVLVATADVVRAVREYTDWHEGQVRVLTYPTAPPALFVGDDNNDLARFGQHLILGQYLVKGPAGDIFTMPADLFAERFTAVAA